jgi:hypothetical protein
LCLLLSPIGSTSVRFGGARRSAPDRPGLLRTSTRAQSLVFEASLADKAVELGIVEKVSHETVPKTLKENELKPHLIKQWVIPPEYIAQFVWRMEQILDLYEEPYDPKRPVVCFDERPCQLLAEVRESLAGKPGKPKRVDFESMSEGLRPSCSWLSNPSRAEER